MSGIYKSEEGARLVEAPLSRAPRTLADARRSTRSSSDTTKATG